MTAVEGRVVPRTPAGLYSKKPHRGAQMTHLLCQLFGHRKTLVPLSSNRYYCRRCGLDFGVASEPTQALAKPPASVKRGVARRLHR
jgi:hypothetical protein